MLECPAGYDSRFVYGVCVCVCVCMYVCVVCMRVAEVCCSTIYLTLCNCYYYLIIITVA